MKNSVIISRLIIVRSQIVPKQLIAFDEYERYSFNDYEQIFNEKSSDYVCKCELFINQIKVWNKISIDYNDKCHQILLFTKALPFFDLDILENFEEYNPFNDFPVADLDQVKEHFISQIEEDNGQFEIGNSWNDDIKKEISWFNSIKKRTFINFCKIYLELLKLLC